MNEDNLIQDSLLNFDIPKLLTDEERFEIQSWRWNKNKKDNLKQLFLQDFGFKW